MKLLKFALLILCLGALLCSCAKESAGDDIQSSKLVIDSYKVQLDHYAALLESMQNELITEREEKFILKHGYESEIEALQKEISGLKQQSGNTANGSSSNQNDKHDVYPEQIEETSASTLYKYEVIEQKLTLGEYVGDKTSVTIPQTVNEVKLVRIGDEAFKNSSVQEVIIPNGIEEIGWFAFSGCRALHRIEVPASVISVEYGAFEYCSPALVIVCERGSYIDTYAQSWGIRVEYK